MKRLFFTIFLLTLSVNAQTFDFQKEGNAQSNEISKNFILEKIPDFKGKIISYFFDIDENGENEIIGIVKHPYFYSLSGYKLLVLKIENGSYKSVKSDVYFDIAQNFEIKNKKITYYKTIFYKNKKCSAKIKKDKIKTKKSLLDCCKDKKAHNIEEITKFSETHQHNDFEIENFHAQKQKNVDFHYVNLNEKTKHYLDLK